MHSFCFVIAPISFEHYSISIVCQDQVIMCLMLCYLVIQDDDGDNAFHIAADAAKMIRENLSWIVQMLQQPSPAVDVRNHRQVILECYVSLI